MYKQDADLSELMAKIRVLKNQTEELSRDRDDLNWTLGVILKFDNFPVKDFCPDKKCQPCPKGWILHQKKCYLFYNEALNWKTWNKSREHCKRTEADLVVIDNLQEQEFISEHIEFYYDIFHGYWIGLNERDDSWFWVDGRNDTLGYWMKDSGLVLGSVALMMPQRNLTESWVKAHPGFMSKFICENDKVLMRPN
ncbi:asialoglycoprotein receptor 2-like [Odontesthes bonariensis]